MHVPLFLLYYVQLKTALLQHENPSSHHQHNTQKSHRRYVKSSRRHPGNAFLPIHSNSIDSRKCVMDRYCIHIDFLLINFELLFELNIKTSEVWFFLQRRQSVTKWLKNRKIIRRFKDFGFGQAARECEEFNNFSNCSFLFMNAQFI